LIFLDVYLGILGNHIIQNLDFLY